MHRIPRIAFVKYHLASRSEQLMDDSRSSDETLRSNKSMATMQSKWRPGAAPGNSDSCKSSILNLYRPNPARALERDRCDRILSRETRKSARVSRSWPQPSSRMSAPAADGPYVGKSGPAKAIDPRRLDRASASTRRDNVLERSITDEEVVLLALGAPR